MSREFPRYTANSGTSDHFANAVCSLCQKILSPDSDTTGDIEAISICGDCKFLFLEDLDTPSTESRRRRPLSRRRTRHRSNESTENLFSQQFSHMISLVRQNHPSASGLEEPPVESDSTARFFQRPSTRTTPSGSGRWRRVFSETESDGLDNVDSVYTEIESVVSFGPERLFHGESDAVSFTTYGEDSDASVDLNGFLDPNEGSDFDSDTDIDPMQAGLNHWNSEEEEEDREWVEGVGEEDRVRNFLFPTRSRRRSRSPDSIDMTRSLEESVWAPDFGDASDYLDSRGLEEFLQHLAEEDGTRRGAPPASASFVDSLPRMVINKEHERKHGGLIACAICKDVLAIGNEANRLPCDHLYHPPCISPWLNTRNSCPLCRYELPTDDRDYEDGKRHIRSRTEIAEARRPVTTEDSSVTFSDGEDDGEEERDEVEVNVALSEGGRGRWLFLAAAPIVGLMGIVLVLWFGNLGAEGSQPLRFNGQHHVHITGSSASQREARSRRWWSFF